MVTNDRKKKILLVDDDETQLAIAETQLEDEYEVTIAMSGDEAVKCLAGGFFPDLIVLDILMPDMDGWETFGRLKALSLLHEVPILFLSTVTEQSEIDRAYEMGATDFLTKPIEGDDFKTRIKKALEGQAVSN